MGKNSYRNSQMNENRMFDICCLSHLVFSSLHIAVPQKMCTENVLNTLHYWNLSHAFKLALIDGQNGKIQFDKSYTLYSIYISICVWIYVYIMSVCSWLKVWYTQYTHYVCITFIRINFYMCIEYDAIKES